MLICAGAVSATSSGGNADNIYVALNGSDSNDGFTWDSPKLSIKNATGTVNTNGSINIADGTYTGVNNTGITIDRNITIIGQSQTGTIINGENTYQIFMVNSGVSLILRNLTLTNGTTSNVGGAILNRGILNLTDCSFTNNTAEYGAGAIYNDVGTCIMTGCTFTGNTGAWSGGGAIFNMWGICIVTGCTFTGNNATTYGGAIFNGGTCNVTGCTFTGNHAGEGGAIHNVDNCEIHFNSFIGNTADEGSAIYNFLGTVNATLNWWGSNNPNFANLINGTVDYTPWLYLTFSPSPTTIPLGSTSTLTASFNNAFNGTTITALDPSNGHIPDGTPVTFNTTLGNVGSKSVIKYTVNGVATAVLRADETTGDALVAAYANDQTPLNATVHITPIANAASSVSSTRTIGMQETGIPLNYLILAILAVISGFVLPKRK